MSKIRNSLGVLVLPIYAGKPQTFDEYKAKTGIDLNEVVTNHPVYGPIIKTTKLICLCDSANFMSNSEELFPPLGVANIIASAVSFPDEDDPTPCALLWYGTCKQTGDGFSYNYGMGMFIDPVNKRIAYYEL